MTIPEWRRPGGLQRVREQASSVAPRTRPSYSLDELLAQCDENAPAEDGDRAWLEAKPIGNELL